ncbi:MAG: transposase, partial [Planctomycetes bacterium]|nr:transposase [Planctomycetota bacterium]
LCRAVRRIFLRAVFSLYRKRAAGEGILGGRTGAVNRIQRFGSALNLNVHFHALVLDGVYTLSTPFARPVFHEASWIDDDDIERVTKQIHGRVLRLLRRRSLLNDEHEISTEESDEHQGLLPLLQAASIQSRVAQGPDAGARIGRLGLLGGGEARITPGSLCAEVNGFSLHAAVRIPAHDRARLEHLCRYVARPPFASARLKWSRRGRLLYELRNPWRDGTTHIVFEPHVFLERLAALIPPPRVPLQTYHGVLAPSASWRDDVVKSRVSAPRTGDTSEEKKRGSARRPPHRYLWAELMRRVFGFEVLRCKVCRSKRRLISMITERSTIVRILAHLGLDTNPPSIQPARAPPQLELGF